MSRLRDLARVVRQLPGVHHVVEASDPARRASRIAASGLIDTELYAAQLGVEEISVDEAAQHYVRYGWLAGLTINALLDPFVIERKLGNTGRPPIYDYLTSRSWQYEVTAVWSAPAYLVAHPDAAEHPAGPVGHLWERVQREPLTTITVLPGGPRELSWSSIGPVLRSATIDWAEQLEAERARHARSRLQHSRHLQDVSVPASGPTVTVVMPVWNRAASMRRAVESVLAQKWPWWELLIVDDGSWDDTPAVAAVLASRDPRIRYIRRAHEGVCPTRNAGIEAATGEYIAFLDSDNSWTERFLLDMITTMERERVETAYATIELHQHPDRELDPDADPDSVVQRYRHGSPSLDSLLQGNSIDLNVLVTRLDTARAIGGFDPSLRRAVDYDFVLKLAERSEIVHVPTVGVEYDDRESSGDRISTTEPFGWNTVVRLRHLPDPVRELTTGGAVIAIAQANDPHLPEKLRELASLREDVAVLIAAVGLEPDEWRSVAVATHDRPAMTARLFHSSDPFAYVVNRAACAVDRTQLLVLDPRTRITAPDIHRLLDIATSDPAAAHMPITVAPNGAVAHAGSVFVTPRRRPGLLFAGQPIEDPRAMGPTYEVPALSGRTFAMSTELFRSAGGLDPLLYNALEGEGLSIRLGDTRKVVHTDIVLAQTPNATAFTRTDPKGSRNVMRSLTAELPHTDTSRYYEPLGQRAGAWTMSEDGELRPIVTRQRRQTTLPDGRTVPVLRWAIVTAAPAGPAGAGWGDTHFANSLASALRQLGQEAIVVPREARDQAARALDDVHLVLRGLDRVQPDPGVMSMVWVISHPDLVTKSELTEFDRVFAASITWARKMSDLWSIPIDPLLQCTDPARFRPAGLPRSRETVFVGKSRFVPRPVVMEAYRAGIDFALYGGEWEGILPPGAVRAEYVPNEELAPLYETASMVLNDHWADMRRDGFLSNRLFDAVAAGGRVLSDDVEGIAEIFGGAVRTYSHVSEIAPLLRGDHDALFVDDDELTVISERVRTEHSFRARAQVLLDNALRNHDWT